MSKYEHFENNQEIEIEEGVGLNFACCDCALVHDLQIRVDESGRVFLSFVRDNRRTGALRRHHGVPEIERLMRFSRKEVE